MPPDSFFIPGETCWRVARADRFTFIVDAADYYRAAKQAILNAKSSVMLIGWDFDSRIELEPRGVTIEGPNRLGPFLSWIADRRPEVEIHLLKWNLGVLETLGRGETPIYLIQWMMKKNIRMKLDGEHPPLASHHQKIVVIDDALAFCGGIDMTQGRWDTREHLKGDPSRRSPWGAQLPPWHDATTCVDGEAARALGALARDRWRRATGEELKASPADSDPWPDDLGVMLEGVDVAVARTVGEHGDQRQVVEIEKLYLAAIGRARRWLYVESQYFASRAIAEAIAARLAEPDGPEVVVVNPQEQDGWLEESTMGAARAKLLRVIKRADVHDRFRMYWPATPEGAAIYVHAKIMIVDDRMLKVGSSNLNNRSMGFDTECDLGIEAGAGDERLSAEIARVRDDLLAEHLGSTAERVAAEIARSGSLIRAIETLRTTTGRRLETLEIRKVDGFEDMLSETDLVDPERPPSFWTRTGRGMKRRVGLG